MAATTMEKNSITEGVIWKQLLFFFFPILIGSFFQQLYNTVDTIVVGQCNGDAALAAVGTTGPVLNLLVGFFVGLSSGATVVISLHYGAKNAENVSKAVHTAIALAIAGGVLLMVLGFVTARPLLHLIKVPDGELFDGAMTYLTVFYIGIIPMLIYNMGTGILRAVGDSKTPLYVLIACCIINILLDLLFVAVFQWGVFGVAFATALAQFISAILIMIKLMRTQESYKVEVRKVRFDRSILGRVIYIGIPSGMQSVMYSVSGMIVQTCINGFDQDAMAAWTAIGRVDGFVWMVLGAFGIAITTFVGQNFGAQKYDRVRKSVRVCLGITMGTTIVLSALLLAFMTPILHVFSSTDAVVELGAHMLWVLCPNYFFFVFIEVLSGAIRGAGEAIQPMLITCVGVCVLRILWALFVIPAFPTITTVALTFPATSVVTCTIYIVYYLRMKWLKRCIVRNGQEVPA